MTALYSAHKHRRPTRTDRLLLWAKDRLTLRRRPQAVLETADFEEALAEQEAEWNRWADEAVAIANTETFARRLLSEDGWAETLADIDELPEVADLLLRRGDMGATRSAAYLQGMAAERAEDSPAPATDGDGGARPEAGGEAISPGVGGAS